MRRISVSTSTPDPKPLPIEPGTILAGKYRVQRILGQGGMGVVVEARHIALDERVALKFLLPEYATHPEASGRFMREARAAVKIKSQNVARVSDVGQLEHGEPYMVMEYLEGSDLSNLLEKSGPFRIEDAVDYTIQACEAIAEAHSYGIVHRDLKPANLFLTKHTDGAPLVKVLDFGISKVTDNGVESLTRTTAAMGSALYMSPEQMQQTRSVDHRTDIYALGVALYEMLAGKQPYYADTLPQLCAEILTGTPTPLRSIRPDVTDAFAAMLGKAYSRDRAARYQSVAEFVVALTPYAPLRSRPSVERVCRMAGFEPPTMGGAMPAGATPIPQPPAAQGGGTQLLQQSEPRITPDPYNGPSSANAAAAFAAGTNGSFARTGGGAAPKSKAPVVVALVAAAVLCAAGVAAFFTVGPGATAPAGDPGTEGSAAVPALETSAPEVPEAPAPDASEAPAEVPSAATSAAPEASSAASAKAGVPPAKPPTAGGKALPTASPGVPPAVPGATNPTNPTTTSASATPAGKETSGALPTSREKKESLPGTRD